MQTLRHKAKRNLIVGTNAKATYSKLAEDISSSSNSNTYYVFQTEREEMRPSFSVHTQAAFPFISHAMAHV